MGSFTSPLYHISSLMGPMGEGAGKESLHPMVAFLPGAYYPSVVGTKIICPIYPTPTGSCLHYIAKSHPCLPTHRRSNQTPPEQNTNRKKFCCLRQCTSKRGWQLANQSLSQASSQPDTQLGFFVSGRRGPKQWGGLPPQTQQWPNGNAADKSLFGRQFEPRSVNAPAPPPMTVGRPGFEPPTENFASAVLPFDRRLCKLLGAF